MRTVRQGIYKSGPGMVGQARRQLSHMQGPTQSIINGTITLSNETAPVVEQDGYFLVASPKFQGRYYVVQATENGWLTSSKEEKFIPVLIGKVEAYIASQLPQAA